MCPRPRKASDEQVFAAASRLMSRLGPAQLRLADVAAEAGLTAGALVQRFGSKRGLLLALTARGANTTGAMFAELRAAHPSPLARLHAYADHFAQMAESPAALARNLAYLQIDLTDPDFHRHIMVQAHATRTALRDLLREGIAAGELEPSVGPSALARTVEAVLSGSLMVWAFYRRGSAASWVRRDLDGVLRPFIGRASHPSGGKTKGRTARGG